MTHWTRRRILAAAAAGIGTSAWSWGDVSAQSSTGLLRAPKHALVIGNGKYRHSPLNNSVNDARGMAAALKSVAFTVTLELDVTKSAMREAIHAFGENLSRNKAVGLFYFAGHGAQLAWRNYLIPVDAEIADVQQLRERAVDLNSLIDGIRRAGNPMNVLILDACRDNPFGSTARQDQKGLSQMDAPPGTLLAYATAPGNTAIDGDGGAHSIYTEHLLREMQVPEAKLEDVFKRVRLGVRRRSRGLQIPWESTSLEDDFWFIPPKEAKKRAEEEIEQEFKQERALWEEIQGATAPEPFENYLRHYPNGRFSELAQLRLDQVLARAGEQKIELVSSPENPYSKGTARTDTAYRVGDSYRYRRYDSLTNREEKPITLRVTQITDDEVIYNKGNMVTDLLGNPRKRGGFIWSANQTVPVEFAVGKHWITRYLLIEADGYSSVVDFSLRIAARERISVPAGSFDAFRVEAQGWRRGDTARNAFPGSIVNVSLNWTTWYAPAQVRHPIAWEWFNRSRYAIVLSQRGELSSFTQS